MNTRASRYEHALRARPSNFLPLKPQILKPRARPSSGATWASLPVADMYEATVVRGSERAHSRLPSSAREVWFLRKIFPLPGLALHAPTLAQTIRAHYWWEAGAPRACARSRTRFARVIECKLLARAFIGQELFWNFGEGTWGWGDQTAISLSRAPFGRGSKLVRRGTVSFSRAKTK